MLAHAPAKASPPIKATSEKLSTELKMGLLAAGVTTVVLLALRELASANATPKATPTPSMPPWPLPPPPSTAFEPATNFLAGEEFRASIMASMSDAVAAESRRQAAAMQASIDSASRGWESLGDDLRTELEELREVVGRLQSSPSTPTPSPTLDARQRRVLDLLMRS